MKHRALALVSARNASGAWRAPLTWLLDALLPRRCPICAARGNGFCPDCRELLPWIVVGCEVCGMELHQAGVCGECQSGRRYYDRAVIPFKYSEPVSAQIKALKYRGQLRHAHDLAAMICTRVWNDSREMPAVLVPIPLHRKRLRQRGFNQSLEVARSIGDELGIEVDHALLARIKHTIPQTGLSKSARAKNVKGAFQANTKAKANAIAHIALVDDVVTSGSTANEAARALKAAGVKTVSIWAAART
ncbi:MAG: ComF family protein [bacterium]